MPTLTFVTTNPHKFAVAQQFFRDAGLLDKIELQQYALETPELQADTVQEVAASSAKWVAEKLGQSVVVADAGLAIHALNGFPGPYQKYLNQTLTPEDVLAMLHNKEDRTADFIDALAYYDPTTKVNKDFTSITKGSIAVQPAQQDGSTVDRLFVPDGYNMPLAAMEETERTKVWNMDRWRQLVEFLRGRTSYERS